MAVPNGNTPGSSSGATRDYGGGRVPILMEGWLVKSREHGLRFPLLKSKWVRRYFVLRLGGENGGNSYVLDEFRSDNKRRLRKSLDLERCTQVDSYLTLSDSSCSARGVAYQWIFSMYFTKKNSEKRVEVYLVADSEELMLKWVSAVCRACRLEKQDGNEDMQTNHTNLGHNSIPVNTSRGVRSEASVLSSSMAGMSLSSNVSTQSFESVIDTPIEDVAVRDMFEHQKTSDEEEEKEERLYEFVFPEHRNRRSEGCDRPGQPPSRFTRLTVCRPVIPPLQSPQGETPQLEWPELEELEGSKPSRNYLHINKFSSRQSPRTPRATRSDGSSLIKMSQRSSSEHKRSDSPTAAWCAESSASACSSRSSSRRSVSDDDDGSSSCVSSNTSNGKETISSLFIRNEGSESGNGREPEKERGTGTNVMARNLLGPQLSSASSSYAGSSQNSRKDLHLHLPLGLNQSIPPPPSHLVDEAADNESSGETIKLHGLEHHHSDRTPHSSYILPSRSSQAHTLPAPPLVDRTKKPSRLKQDSEDERERIFDIGQNEDRSRTISLGGYHTMDRPFRPPHLPKTTPKRVVSDGPKSAGLPFRGPPLDYFDPIGSRSPSDRRLTKSPHSSTVDMDYIKIDAERTQAVKHLIAQRSTFD